MARRSYLTTFEVSKICEVNPTTVQNWVKEKKLKAYVTPGGHRRVRREDLVAFMSEFGMPIPDGLIKERPLVLIVDDEPDTLDFLISVLKSDDGDLEVRGAPGGVEALLMIGERKPDLLILDILMPGMNGFEVCRKLKSSRATRKIKIVAITGDHSDETRTRIMEAGADLFFTKPINVSNFRAECFKLMRS